MAMPIRRISTLFFLHRCSHRKCVVLRYDRIATSLRKYSDSKQKETKSEIVKNEKWQSKYAGPARSTPARWLLDMFQKFIAVYESILERRFPKIYGVYRMFTLGIKAFYVDTQMYTDTSKKLRGGVSLKDLSREQIENYHKMPRDIRKIAPVLILAIPPVIGYLVLPLVYFFPRQVLTSHFWSLQQKFEFQLVYLKQRMVHYKPAFRHLQAGVDKIEDKELHLKFTDVLHKLGSGTHPTATEVLSVKDLFTEQSVYALYTIHPSHITSLIRMHNLSGFWLWRRRRLWWHAGMIREIDLAIERESALATMGTNELKNACFLRGLNPVNMPNEQMVQWLSQWILVTKTLNSKNLSLILHCPILLGYNHPSNWQLIH